MRTLTTTQTAVFDAVKRGARPAVFAKVEIDRDGAGSWVDLSDLDGRDYVVSVTISEDRNNEISTAQITLVTCLDGRKERSLSPEATSSLPNTGGVLIQGDRKVRIYTATLPDGSPKPTSGSSNWVKAFEGRLTRPTVTADKITIQCRDKGGELQSTWIETVQTYGDSAGANIEDVIDDLLTDWARTSTTLYSANGTSGTPFNAGDSPGFGILEYKQQRMPIMTAIKTLADQIGYQLSFRYHEGSGIDDYVLVLEEPDRAVSSSAWTVPLAAIDGLTIVDDDTIIRNVWIGTYGSYANGGQRTAYSVEDATSITTYGRRTAFLGEASGKQIDTETEMDNWLDQLLLDTKDTSRLITFEMPYAYHLQTNDYITIEADGFLLGSNKDISIMSIQHSIGGGEGRTRLVCRGKPSNGEVRHASKMVSDTLRRINLTGIGSGLLGAPGSASKLSNGSFGDFGDG